MAIAANLRLRQTALDVRQLAQHRAFDANDTFVVGEFITANVGDPAITHPDQHTAACPAVTTDRLVPGFCSSRRHHPLQRSPHSSAQTIRRRHAA
jgi:hypothetical protein